MTQKTLDSFDIRILTALQKDGALGNNALADIVHLSPSQCSRRRASLEASGVIEAYRACLSADKLGVKLRAIVRLNLTNHDRTADENLSAWLASRPEIQTAFSISGDADYVLLVRVADLESFSRFVHDKLLQHPLITQVRSEFVLKTLKDDTAIPLTAEL